MRRRRRRGVRGGVKLTLMRDSAQATPSPRQIHRAALLFRRATERMAVAGDQPEFLMDEATLTLNPKKDNIRLFVKGKILQRRRVLWEVCGGGGGSNPSFQPLAGHHILLILVYSCFAFIVTFVFTSYYSMLDVPKSLPVYSVNH